MSITNSIHLLGHCASDPQVFHNKNGKLEANVAVYTKNWWRVQSEEVHHVKDTCHKCVFYGKNAERAQKLLLKGTQVTISGTLEYLVKHHAGKQFKVAQVKVDEFMNSSTKALMTKELYDSIFPELVVPYQISARLDDGRLDFDIIVKLADIQSDIGLDEAKNTGIEIEIVSTKPSYKELMIVSPKEANKNYSITQNKFIRRFSIHSIKYPIVLKKEILKAAVTVSIIFAEKRLFECNYVLDDLLSSGGENEC